MSNTIYTIGHSNIEPQELIRRLKEYNIDYLIDIRSAPYSKHTPQFNKEAIEKFCKANKMHYYYLGNLLGGKPSDNSVFYNGTKVDYQLLSRKDYFLSGINKLISLTNKYNACLMCSEGKPHNCHRSLLVSPILEKYGINVLHIMPDGKAIDSSELTSLINNGQLVLF